LRRGLDTVGAGSRGAAIFLGDQPRIEASAIAEVIRAFDPATKPVARPLYRGTPGHPVVVAREAFEAFGAAPGDAGARAFLERSDDVVLVDIDTDAPLDVDTWDDFEVLEG
jgi:CTP:molybdopterin cytidylyltransferase MocA